MTAPSGMSPPSRTNRTGTCRSAPAALRVYRGSRRRPARPKVRKTTGGMAGCEPPHPGTAESMVQPGASPCERDDSRYVRWSDRPRLDRPIVIAAFEGWNDAGDAATTAARFLRDAIDAEPFAEIDPEEFYDFATTRPRVEFDDDDQRRIVWP